MEKFNSGLSIFSKIGWEDRKNGRESVFRETSGLIFSRIDEKHKFMSEVTEES